jgi:hypothetical protein
MQVYNTKTTISVTNDNQKQTKESPFPVWKYTEDENGEKSYCEIEMTSCFSKLVEGL